MTGSSANQTLTINGSGFQSGLKVNLTGGASPIAYQGSAIVSQTATQIQVSVNVGAAAGTWAVQVVNPNNVSSNSASLTVTAATPPPVIGSLSPNPMPVSASNQTLTINGSGFATGASVNLTYAGGSVVHPTIATSTGTKITATVNVGATARTWTVQVVNSAASSSNIVNLVVSVPPVISSLSPNPMTGSSANQTLTVNGSGFQSGLKVVLTGAASPVAYQGSAVASQTATQIQALVNVGAAAGAWTVQVVNPDGSSSNAASLTVTAAALPVISSLSPNPMTGSSADQTLTINGSNFQPGLQVKLTSGVSTTTYQASSLASQTATQIQVAVNVGLAAGAWTVQVVNPNNVLSNAATLTVTAAPPPAISSLSPNPMSGSAQMQTLTINGSGFQAGLKVTLTTGSTTNVYVGTSIASITATQIKVNVSVGAAAHTWAVEVVNSNNAASSPVNLTVTAAAPPPVISSLSPNPMTGSASAQTLTIAGTGFQSGVIVLMEPTNASSATEYSGAPVTATATQLKVQVNVGSTQRSWYLQLVNPDGQYSNLVLLQVD
jgi:hypothetical protein